jgi:predicted O-linked N-acetylglucosamine transferase (SPINDLY family)
VFLDSIGWSGCNSALECLAQALPLVTFEGTSMRGRHSAAILRMLDIPDTIAASVDDYVAIAIRLGQDADFRHQMAARMAENRDKVYRDRAPITALEDVIETAVRNHAS